MTVPEYWDLARLRDQRQRMAQRTNSTKVTDDERKALEQAIAERKKRKAQQGEA